MSYSWKDSATAEVRRPNDEIGIPTDNLFKYMLLDLHWKCWKLYEGTCRKK